MTREVRFQFTDGQVHGLWFDEFEALYRALGIREVGRASTVEWSPEHEQWEVRLQPSNELIGRFDRRDEAIAFEVAYIQERM
jgi:hypothetical protein